MQQIGVRERRGEEKKRQERGGDGIDQALHDTWEGGKLRDFGETGIENSTRHKR